MTKTEAIKKFVERDFSGIPQEWVQIVMEKKDIYESLPMWGTMWIVDNFLGKRLMKNAIQVIEPEECAKENKTHDKNTTCDICEDYEEMISAYNIKDKDGDGTAAYIYDIDGTYVMGIHGAGWNFYDGVWDKLYDKLGLGLEWHDVEDVPCNKCGGKRDVEALICSTCKV